MPKYNDIPSIEISNVHRKENLQPVQRQSLSRSPHSYYYRRDSRLDNLHSAGRMVIQPSPEPDAEEGRGRSNDSGNTDEGWLKGAPLEDSGTDADDESGLVLQSLPAPPLKWRKGLKGQDGQGAASPLLTPSYLDDEERRLALERQLQRLSGVQSPISTDDETRKIREKFSRRRRAELLRRTLETLLLGAVGYVTSILQIDSILDAWYPEITIYSLIILGTYVLYPVRLYSRHSNIRTNERRSLRFIWIPAAFDPATLLYPVLIPVFVAFSLVPKVRAVVLPNLILSISSMPRAILPFHDWSLGQSSFHWAISILPLALSSNLRHRPQQSLIDEALPGSFEAEYMIFLYPLHQALLPTLGYLTTTSLLPAELQLLSVSMINLLLFSTSPQSTILKALLWIGGTSVFILCGYVLRLGVALARVPSWRFRHPRLRSRDGYILLSAIDDCFHRRLSKWFLAMTESKHSGRDEWRSRTEVITRAADRSIDGDTANPSSSPEASRFLSHSQRRHTLPSYLTSQPTNSVVVELEKFSKQQSTKKKSHQLTSLTNAQAIVLKWTIAGFVYGMVFTIIAFPVRGYISQQALSGREPVGWALGYLFGNVPVFRQTIFQWALEDWVPLPEPYNKYHEGPLTTWAETWDQFIQGAANTRLLMCIYCLCTITVGLATVSHLNAYVEVDTRRKVFHGMMVVMFLPSTFVDPPFVALAFALILSLFVLLDLFRASQLPPLSGPLTRALAPYVDGRDYRGPVIVSHMFLLIGCAIPLWLSLAGTEMVGEAPWDGWETASRDLSMVSGVICVGLGDAAASLIGRRYGRRRWCWSGGKSLEGSFAFALAVVIGLSFGRAWLLFGGWAGDSGDSWSLTLGKASVAAAGASLTEAVLTGGNDNVMVPVILWLLVRGLRI